MNKKQIMEELKYVQEVLQRWDPIGVIADQREAGIPLSEYDSYAPTILTMLRKGCNEKKLAQHLGTIQSLEMGLAPLPEKDYKIAEELINWWKSKNQI